MSFLTRIIRNSEKFSKYWIVNQVYYGNDIFKGCSMNFSKLNVPPKSNVPVPPKRPLTAYMIFCQESRQELLKELPGLTMVEQVKILADKWNHLSVELKKPFELKAREGTLLYGEEHKKFYENLSEDQKEQIAKQKEEKKESRRQSKLRKALKESGIPKQPVSAYALFVQSCAKSKNENKQLSDFIKEAAEKWKTLPEETKQSFESQAEADKARYATQMDQWRAKLLKEGNEKLLQAYEDSKLKRKVSVEVSVTLKPRSKKDSKEKEMKKTNETKSQSQ